MMRNSRVAMITSALLGAAASVGLKAAPAIIQPYSPKRPTNVVMFPDENMHYGLVRRSGRTVAQAKRAAIKARNRARNKAAHRG